MERITSNLGYSIDVDYEIDRRVAEELAGENRFVVTDSRVYALYRGRIDFDALGDRLYVVRAGEASKQLKVAGKICERMLAVGCDRATEVVALGGGVIGDLAGFVAAIFMRGVAYVQIPTTLLAMVDSSVGGKTAVDLGDAKNIIGVFKQPSRVLVCVDFLATLPQRELRSGLGEVIKTALLDEELFGRVQSHLTELFVTESEFIFDTIVRCIRFKIGVVERDERETGLRKILNLGHTIGHGLEAADGHRLSHGEYVLNGIRYELQLARFRGCVDEEYARRIALLVETALESKFLPLKRIDRVLRYAASDKKNRNGNICCILPVREGETQEAVYSKNEFRQALERLV